MRLAIFDISGLAHATWHASAHKSVNNMYDHVLRVVRGHLDGAAFDRVVVACDAPGRKLRHDISEDYKANREAPDPALKEQLNALVDQLQKDGCHVFKKRGYEADDIIASIVEWARDDGSFVSVEVISDDKDMAALVHDATGDSETEVTLYRPRQAKRYRRADVIERWGVPPEGFFDFLALCGDTADNIPGVKGVGPKTALRLLKEHRDLEGLTDAVLNKATDFTPALAANLRDSIEEELVANRSRALVELAREALSPDECETILAPPKTVTDTPTEGPPMESTPFTEAPAAADTQPGASQPAEEKPTPAPKSAPQQSSAMTRVAPQWSLRLEPTGMKQAWWIAEKMVQSGMFRKKFANPAQGLVAIMAGRERGLGAFQSMQSIDIVEGQPRWTAHSMVGMVQASPVCEYFMLVDHDETHATYETKRRGHPRPVSHTYTIDDARLAGLVRPNGNWAKRPKSMLRKQAGVELARMVYQDIVNGMYCPEEVTDGEYVVDAEVAA